MLYESFCAHNIYTIAIPIIPRPPRIMKYQMKNILEIDALYENGAQNGRSVVRLCANPNAA